MKSVIFKKIKIKNFLSIGNDWVEINYNPGINVVTGLNYDKNSRNGIGKSAALTDSLSFVLFGAPLREIKKEFISNRYTKKGAKILLSFDVIADGNRESYAISRSLDPSRLQLFKSGQDITKSSIPKTTDFVCKLIGITPEVFANTIVMTLNGTIPFMAQKKVDKRKFIEGVLKLEIFSNMLLLARQEHNEYKKEYEIENARLEDLKRSLIVYIEQQTTFEQNKQDRIVKLNSRRINNENEIKEFQPKLVEITTNIENVSKNIELLQIKEAQCDTNINDMFQIIGIHEAGIKHIKDLILEIETRGEICTKCKRSYTDKDKNEAIHEKIELEQQKQHLEQQILNEKSKMEKLGDTKEKCRQRVLLFRKELEKNNLQIKENENLLSRIEQLSTWNKQIIEDIAKLNNDIDPFNNLIEETKNREITLAAKCAELKTKLLNLETVKFIVSEEGVKSFIVKKILRMLNTKLMYYLKKFDTNCSLTFNEYFEEQLIDDKGEETTYNNFSAGERKRIDLACLFTFQDIRRLQGDVSTNISVYDELFDTSLEEIGVNMALDILKERVDKYSESSYVISHKKDVQKYLVGEGELIFLEKRQGITSRAKFPVIEVE